MSKKNPVEAALWKTDMAQDNDQYFTSLLEQYKLYVEMADRISQRRAAANTFFLTFNTAIVGALSTLFDDIPRPAAIAIYVTAVGFCLVWILLLRSYRNLNSAKFRVIGYMEKQLPASPYWGAEWMALGQGRDYRKYLPLSVLETWVPVGFAGVYVYLAYITFWSASETLKVSYLISI